MSQGRISASLRSCTRAFSQLSGRTRHITRCPRARMAATVSRPIVPVAPSTTTRFEWRVASGLLSVVGFISALCTNTDDNPSETRHYTDRRSDPAGSMQTNEAAGPFWTRSGFAAAHRNIIGVLHEFSTQALSRLSFANMVRFKASQPGLSLVAL